MGSTFFGIKITSDLIPQLLSDVDADMKSLMAAAALGTEAQAKANIQANGTIDTGAMLNGVYAVAPGVNEASGAASQVESLRPGHALDIGDETDGLSEFGAACASAADYSVFIEYGTMDSPAWPFMTPAGDTIDAQLDQLANKIFLARWG